MSVYTEDTKLVSAVHRQLAIIGEATRRLSDSTRALRSSVPWQDWIAFRNVLVHAYDRIDDHLVYDVIHNELQGFRRVALELLEELQNSEQSKAGED